METTTPSMLIASTSVPTSGDDLWDNGRLILANWQGSIELASSWATAMTSARSGAEKRCGFTGKPSRQMRYNGLSLGQTDAWSMSSNARRSARARNLVPIVPDVLRIAADSSGTTINCIPAYRRFYPGGRVMVAKPSWRRGVWEFIDVRTIATVFSTGITVTVALSTTYDTTCRIYPLMECDVVSESTMQLQSGTIMSYPTVARETVGTSALPPAAYKETIDLPTFEGFLVWAVRPNLVKPPSEGFKRDVMSGKSGIANLFQLGLSEERWTSNRNMTALKRADAWKLIEFFDANNGMLFPFWTTSSLYMFDVTEINAGTMKVRVNGPLTDWHNWTAIALWLRSDPTPVLGRIASVSRASGLDTITFEDNIDPPALSDVRHATIAALCRFNTDEMVESWRSGDVMDTNLKVIELLREQTVEVLET